MKALQHAAGILAVIAVILVLGVTAIDIAAYSDFGYYEREYTRLGVLNDVPIEMDELMNVTREMMAYLRGKRDDLVINAVIDGEEREFFNDQEKVHMSDVRTMFLTGILIRRISLAVAAAMLLFLFLSGLREKRESGPSAISRIFPVYFQCFSVLFLGAIGVIACLCASDFTRWFTLFHEIFFDNDLWLFDPATSRLINVVPEPFWSAVSLRCAMLFLGLVALVFTGCTIWRVLAFRKPPKPRVLPAFVLALVLALTPAVPARAAGIFGALGGAPAVQETTVQETAAPGAEAPAGTEAVPESEAAVASAAATGNGLPPLRDLTTCPDWPQRPDLDAQNAILIEAKTGAILGARNPDEACFPASITKLMTALLVLENCSLDDTVTFSYRATHELEAGSTHIARTEDEQMSVRDCLYALLLASANEVAQALAEHVGGSIEHFADMMNARAVELGCTNTHFANPSGLNNESHYTTCHDMALIMRACAQLPEFLEIEEATTYTIPATNKNPEALTIAQKHKLVKQGGEHYDGALAGKTGYTSLAGNTLVTYAVRGDMELIVVVMKSYGTHYDDTVHLLDYGFGNFSMVHLADAENPSRLAGGSVNLPDGTFIPDSDWLVLPGSLNFADLDARVEGLNGVADESGNKPVGRIVYSHAGADVGSATLLVPASVETTAAETTAAETTVSESETQTARESSGGPFRIIRNGLKKAKDLPLPSGKGFVDFIAFALDHWQIALGIIVLIVILLLMLIIRGGRSRRRRRRNYRYGGYTSTKKTRNRPNRYTMRIK